MKKTGPFSRAHLQLLRGVSRSFYLSIRLLPSAMQAPVAVGYLLARATDTVADTTGLPHTERLQLLTALMAAIGATGGDLQHCSQALADFAGQQTDPHERALMQALPGCLPLLQALSPEDQASVRWVLGHITRGQVLDVQRFGSGPAALATESELDEYTWLVAGCVGEFWTELCERHQPGWATQGPDAMRVAARAYGMGLQRLNILRDAGADLAAGRCYLPMDRLGALGLSPEAVMQAARTGHVATLQRLAPLWDHWLENTLVQLSQGVSYSQCLTRPRLRLASALPALVGARTVALLRQTGPQSLTQSVKMPRHEMRTLLWRLLWRLASPQALDREFRRLSQ